MNDTNGIAACVRLLTSVCHQAAVNAGWHNDPDTGKLRTPADHDRLFTHAVMLVVTELAEAVEGHRCGLMDDHLPHRTMMEAELADALIRICNLAGAMGFDLGATVAEKIEYNAQRADHKAAARQAPGGKKY